MKMEIQNNTNLFGECRCCLSKGRHRDMLTEYDLFDQQEVYLDVFRECFNIFLSVDSRLSTLICEVCTMRLKDAQSFRKQVLESEKIMKNAFDEGDTEYVYVADPLDENDDLKEEIKFESASSFSDGEVYALSGLKEESNVLTTITNEDLDTIKTGGFHLTQYLESEDLIPGEKELLQRFKKIKSLPTKSSLVDVCPGFYHYLNSLKDKVIKPDTIEETLKTPQHRKARKRTVPEKIAQAHNAMTVLENSNATIFKSKMRSGFPCFYCRDIFEKPKELRHHQAKHSKTLLKKLLMKYTSDALIVYADVTDLKCTICDKEIPTFKYLKEHLVDTHNKNFHDISDRVIPFKLGDRESNFDCHICDINFETFGAVDRHMNVHFKNYICEECGSGFITKHRLKVHTYQLHKKGVLINCKECKKEFPTKHKYRIHFDSVHRKIKKMKCPKCSDTFVDYFSRQRHMEAFHGFQPILYKCTDCDKSFNRKYTLTCHYKRRHSATKDVQCDLCPFMCFFKSELTAHMYTHRGDKPFECSVCKKAFVRKKTLAVHMRVHSSDMRYNCHLCGETFVQSWNLKSHLKSHCMELDVR